jgi:hypothetical protein
MPFADVGKSMGDKGANPQGALMMQMEAVEKVLNNMARMNDKMKPYADRAMSVLKAGMSEVSGPSGEAKEAGPMTAQAPQGEKPSPGGMPG